MIRDNALRDILFGKAGLPALLRDPSAGGGLSHAAMGNQQSFRALEHLTRRKILSYSGNFVIQLGTALRQPGAGEEHAELLPDKSRQVFIRVLRGIRSEA